MRPEPDDVRRRRAAMRPLAMPPMRDMTAMTALAIMLVATPAQAQDKRLIGRVEPDVAASVTRLADSVRALGLPSEPLVAVALEGASRRATSERILAAVREYAAALGSARQMLGDAAASDEIVSAAGVIVAGVAPRFVSDYRAARPSGSLTVPLVVLADLVARGVPPDTAAMALGAALRNGARDDELAEFRRRVERDILAGAKPSTAMTIRTRDLPGMPTGGVGPLRTKSPRLRRPGLRELRNTSVAPTS